MEALGKREAIHKDNEPQPHPSSKISKPSLRFAYWNPKILEQDKLMNSQNGEYLDVRTTLLKQEKIAIKGKNIAANCYEMIASKNGVEKLKIQLWYDQNMQWVALKSPTPIGDIFYKLL